MIVYCEPCGDLHHLFGVEAERVIYALQGLAWDADRRPAATEADVPPDRPVCLFDALRLSNDGEAYGEWTDNLVDRRRATQQVRTTHDRAAGLRDDAPPARAATPPAPTSPGAGGVASNRPGGAQPASTQPRASAALGERRPGAPPGNPEGREAEPA